MKRYIALGSHAGNKADSASHCMTSCRNLCTKPVRGTLRAPGR
jgi:hypothetical protein